MKKSKKEEQINTSPFQLMNQQVEAQLNIILQSIENHSSNSSEEINKVKLSIDILFDLEQAGFIIMKTKEKNFLYVINEE